MSYFYTVQERHFIRQKQTNYDIKPNFKKRIIFHLYHLQQEYPNYGPWAASGPPISLIRPTQFLAYVV